jgi:hypothetical protein
MIPIRSQDDGDEPDGFVRLMLCVQPGFKTEQAMIDYCKFLDLEIVKSWFNEVDGIYNCEVLCPEPRADRVRHITKQPNEKEMQYERTMAPRQQTESVPNLPKRRLVPIRDESDAVPPRSVKPPAQGTLW